MKHTVVHMLNLAVLANRVRVRPGGIAAVVVSAAKASGTFANDLTLRRFIAGVGPVDFATPRVVGNGESVVLSSADMEACEAIEVAVATNETGWAIVTFEVESESAPEVIG